MRFSVRVFISTVIIFLCAFINKEILASPKPDTLAIVGGQPITTADFQNRFELSVYPGKDEYDNLYQVKRGFLESMVAERLLADAESMQPADSSQQLLKNNIEQMFLRDALYRTEVLPKTKVTKAEIEKGIKLSSYYYIVDAFYMPDSVAALIFYNKVTGKNAINIYEVTDSLHVSHDTLQIGYGESTPEIENAFFGFNVGYISKPALTEDGWVIFRIISKEVNKKFTSPTPQDRWEMVRKIIKSRKEDKIGYQYLLSVMKNQKVNVNYRLFRPIIYDIQKMLVTHKPQSFDKGYYLSYPEIIKLKEMDEAKLNIPMLQYKGGTLSLDYVLDQLPYAGFNPKNTTIGEITASFHAALKFIIQNYFLALRAKKLGLENSSEVKYNVSMFLNAYRSEKLANEIVDTVKVTPEQVGQYLSTHQDEVLNTVKLRVQIFKVENIDAAADVLNRLNKIRKGEVDTAGAIWVRASEFGDLGAVLAQLKNGKIFGPVFLKDKYTIIRVLDKKSTVSPGVVENSLQVAHEMLVAQRRKEVLDKYLAHLADEQNVKIYLNKLGSLSVTPIEMLTFRYIGFGGKILAVPSLYPHENWTKYYKKPGNVIP